MKREANLIPRPYARLITGNCHILICVSLLRLQARFKFQPSPVSTRVLLLNAVPVQCQPVRHVFHPRQVDMYINYRLFTHTYIKKSIRYKGARYRAFNRFNNRTFPSLSRSEKVAIELFSRSRSISSKNRPTPVSGRETVGKVERLNYPWSGRVNATTFNSDDTSGQ